MPTLGLYIGGFGAHCPCYMSFLLLRLVQHECKQVHTGEVLIKNGGPNASWLVSIEPIIIVHIFTRGFLIVTIIIIIKGATSSFSFRHYPHSMLALRKKPSLQLHLY